MWPFKPGGYTFDTELIYFVLEFTSRIIEVKVKCGRLNQEDTLLIQQSALIYFVLEFASRSIIT